MNGAIRGRRYTSGRARPRRRRAREGHAVSFHPAEFLHRTGISEALRTLPVIAGIVLFFVGGLLFSIGTAAMWTGPVDSPLGLGLALLVSAGLMAGGAYCLWRGVANVRERREIARTGTATMGRVVRVEGTPLSINGVVQLAVCFTYQDGDGRKHESVTPPMDPEDANVWREGGEGHVRYHPVHPARAVWIGRSSLDLPEASLRGKRRRNL